MTSISSPKKDEKYLQRLCDQGEVADIEKMSPQALILDLFLCYTHESPKTKYIREFIVQFLMEHDDRVRNKHLNEVMTFIKFLLSRKAQKSQGRGPNLTGPHLEMKGVLDARFVIILVTPLRTARPL